MAPSLAERLKNETRALHAAAERTPLMAALLSGRLPLPAYAALLRNLHAIYAALEPALARHAALPLLAPVCIEGLARSAALERDLRALAGVGWAAAIALQPSARHYAQRVRDLEATEPARLLAHGYVRYLGDLSGGQTLCAAVARAFGPVTAFYAFGDAVHTAALTRAVRSGLAALAPPADEADAIVAEARQAFAAHRALFEELAATVPLQVDGVTASLHR